MTNEKFTPGRGGAFGEPWEVEASPAHVEIMRADRLRTCVAEVYAPEDQPVGRAELVRDFGRAVACVNACAGLADPSVVPELVEVLRPFAEALDRAERNGARLVGVLCQWMEPGAEREYVGSTSTCGPDDFERARALLARIGGEG